MLQSILSDEQAKLLRDEKAALADMRTTLSHLDVPRESLDTLEQAILQLDELFLIVVVGEFNSGKSSLVNALLGEKVLAEGVTPTTSRVTLVKWGAQMAERIEDGSYATFTYPLTLLQQLNIVDTPGTNAVIRKHERLTDEFVPRSDLVLFVTSADRPMTESERQFLMRIRSWGKKVVVTLNKSDILEDEKSQTEVRDFVLQHVQDVLGVRPDFFAVSARLAQRAKHESDQAESERLLAASGIGALEQYVHGTLDDRTRLQLKFVNPLGVAAHIVETAQAAAQAQSDALLEDKDTVTAVESVVTAYDRELKAELPPRLAEVDNILHRLKERGLDFFDSTMRLTKIMDLSRGDKVRAQFERQVLSDVPQQVDERVRRLIDWLVEKDLHQWQQIMTYLQRRQARYTEHIVGEGVAPLDSRRRALIDSVGKTATTIVETYDRTAEASELAGHVEAAVAQVALLEVGAVGLGAAVMMLIASSAADITGLLAAGTLAIVGLFVIPYKRKQAKDRFSEKMELLRDKLRSALTTQFSNEADTAISRMQNSVAPYTRFVRAERERIEQNQAELDAMQKQVGGLKGRVDEMRPA